MDNIKDIMELDVDNLKKKQYDALLKHTKSVLSKMMSLLDNGEFDKIEEEMLCDSPAGDGYGADNVFIDFGYTDEEMDIEQIMTKLRELK